MNQRFAAVCTMQFVHHHHKLFLIVGKSSINALKLLAFTGVCISNRPKQATMFNSSLPKRLRITKDDVHAIRTECQVN